MKMLPHNREIVVLPQGTNLNRTNSHGEKVTLEFDPYPLTENNDDPLFELFWVGSDGYCYDSYGVAHEGFRRETPSYKKFNHIVD